MPAQTDTQQTSTTAHSTPSKPSSYFLTILRGQTTNVLHMDNSIIDFHIITPSPHIAGRFYLLRNFLFLIKNSII